MPPSLLQRLKERKLVQWALAYLAGAWVLLEATAHFVDQLGWPGRVNLILTIVAAVGLVVVLLLAWVNEGRPESGLSGEPRPGSGEPDSSLSERKSIVVLPFANLSPETDTEYFSDGLTEEVIADLSGLRNLRVISRTSAMRLKGSEKDIPTIGQELKVQYVLEGSVRRAGNHLRITAQLIDALEDDHIWAEKYEGDLEDVFGMQESLSQSIVQKLEAELTDSEARRLEKRPIGDFRAYDSYLKAKREISRFSEEGLLRAIEYLDSALEQVGENSYLYAGLGYAHFQLVNIGAEVEAVGLPKAEDYGRRAFGLDPGSAVGHQVLGLVEFKKGNPWGAVAEFQKALQIDPGNEVVLFWMSVVFGNAGRIPEGTRWVEALEEVDPLSPITLAARERIHWMNGEFGEAARIMRQVRQMDPANPAFWFVYALILAQDGRTSDSLAQLKGLRREFPESLFARMGSFLQGALEGREVDLKECLGDTGIKTARGDECWSWFVSEAFSLRGMHAEALDWIENATRVGFLNYPMLAEHDPLLEGLRGEAGFQDLMAELKPMWEKFPA